MGTRRIANGTTLSFVFVTLVAGCVRREESAGLRTASLGGAVTKRDAGEGAASDLVGARPPAVPAAAPAPSVSAKPPAAPAEVIRRANRAIADSRKALAALKEQPSPRTLAVTCGTLGELKAYLVVSAYLVNDGLLVDSAVGAGQGAGADPLADPLQWISSAQSVAPLCARRGSTLDDFFEDVDSVLGNLGKVEVALGRLKAAH